MKRIIKEKERIDLLNRIVEKLKTKDLSQENNNFLIDIYSDLMNEEHLDINQWDTLLGIIPDVLS